MSVLLNFGRNLLFSMYDGHYRAIGLAKEIGGFSGIKISLDCVAILFLRDVPKYG